MSPWYKVGKIVTSILILLAGFPAFLLCVLVHGMGAFGPESFNAQAAMQNYLLIVIGLYWIPAAAIWTKSKAFVCISIVLLAPTFLICFTALSSSPFVVLVLLVYGPWGYYAKEAFDKKPTGQVDSKPMDKMRAAREVWSYLSRGSTRQKSDGVIVMCSSDLLYCKHACKFIEDGLADYLVLSGDEGSIDKYKTYALEKGISSDRISVVIQAVAQEQRLNNCKSRIPDAQVITLVSAPHTLLRMKLLASSLWPEEIKILCSAPAIHFPEDPCEESKNNHIVAEMAAEISWIQQHAGKGNIPPHKLSSDILRAWRDLMDNF